jgi:hypothetical protein
MDQPEIKISGEPHAFFRFYSGLMIVPVDARS